MATTKITIKSNSAIKVEGEFEIVDGEGRTYDLGGRNVISLCRCGLSKNMPFCDGEHKGQFCHEAVAFNLQPKKES
jgi:CDGSH-type Zn-finger protein